MVCLGIQGHTPGAASGCRGDQDTLQGESPHPIFLLCFCLALFYLLSCLLHYIKTQKKN
jgi:hypothetical protein